MYYRNQTINLDGYVFTNCCFEGCILISNTGVFAINACRIVGGQVYFGENALRVLRLYHGFYGPSQFKIFNPDSSSDGLVTIG